jgi:hypothetical protein
MARHVIKSNPDFKAALTRLASDTAYRSTAIREPSVITSDFKLSTRELYALREAAKLSGHDIAEIDAVITSNQLAAVDVDVDHCCCCCCCCGETAVA